VANKAEQKTARRSHHAVQRAAAVDPQRPERVFGRQPHHQRHGRALGRERAARLRALRGATLGAFHGVEPRGDPGPEPLPPRARGFVDPHLQRAERNEDKKGFNVLLLLLLLFNDKSSRVEGERAQRSLHTEISKTKTKKERHHEHLTDSS